MLLLIKQSESTIKVPRKRKRAKVKQDTVNMSWRGPSRLLISHKNHLKNLKT